MVDNFCQKLQVQMIFAYSNDVCEVLDSSHFVSVKNMASMGNATFLEELWTCLSEPKHCMNNQMSLLLVYKLCFPNVQIIGRDISQISINHYILSFIQCQIKIQFIFKSVASSCFGLKGHTRKDKFMAI